MSDREEMSTNGSPVNASRRPIQLRDLDALQARQQRRDVIPALVLDDFRRGDGQRADEVPLVVIHAEIERIVREINVGLRLYPVMLRPEEIKLTGLQLDHERAFRGGRAVARLPALGDQMLALLHVRRSEEVRQ